VTAQTALLVFEGLHSPFGGPFDLAVVAGECVCVQGASGAGKSVLLRLIADMDPNSGHVYLNGHPREHWSAPEWRRQVVYQAAEPAWWAPTAGEHFRPAERAAMGDLVTALNLPVGVLDTDIARLSTGERQRLALIRSLVQRPLVLLLDEPTASLDPASTQAMEALLCQRLGSGLAIVMVTHSLEQAQRMGHRRFNLIERRLQAA